MSEALLPPQLRESGSTRKLTELFRLDSSSRVSTRRCASLELWRELLPRTLWFNSFCGRFYMYLG
jgi:hypothetical protein